jgi:hypothetical protein
LYQLNARNGSAERVKARLDVMLLPSSRLEARPLAPLDRDSLPTPIMPLALPCRDFGDFFEEPRRGATPPFSMPQDRTREVKKGRKEQPRFCVLS